MRAPLAFPRAVLLILLVFLLARPAGVSAQTVDASIGQGIGTVVADVFGDGTNVAVHTSIDSVTYGAPRLVHRGSLTYYEVLGSVQGTGWGGSADTLGGPGPTFDAESHYAYDVPFVLRWRADFDGTLIVYAHGYPNLGLSTLTEFFLGAANEARRFDELESLYVSDGALAARRGHAMFAANLGGLRRDGGFAAAAAEGPFAGAPLNVAVDVPIARDLAQVAKRLAARFSGKAVRRTIGAGHSGGALVMQWIAGGVTTPIWPGPHQGTRVFTGGNFANAYDPSSGVIFDGVIPIAGGAPLLHPAFPASAPIILLAGSADYAAVDTVVWANRILRAGIDVNQVLRVYQVSNLPHIPADLYENFPVTNAFLEDFFGAPTPDDADRIAPVLAAAVDNMHAWLTRGTPPPPSRVNGRAVDADHNGVPDAIAFTQHGGAETSVVPFVEDPSIDGVLFGQFELSAAGGFPGATLRYAEILNALDHGGSIALPTTACRVGGYTFVDGAWLNPFADLDQRWPSLQAWRKCVTDTIKGLEAEGLYDKKLGTDVAFTPALLSLFQ